MRRILSLFLSLSILLGLNIETINIDSLKNQAALSFSDTEVEVDDDNWVQELDDSNYVDFAEAMFNLDADALYDALDEKSEIMPEKSSFVEIFNNNFFDDILPRNYSSTIDSVGELAILYRMEDDFVSARLYDLDDEESFNESGSLRTAKYLANYNFNIDENGRILLDPSIRQTIDLDLPYTTSVYINDDYEITRNENRDFSNLVSYTEENLYPGNYKLTLGDTEVLTVEESELEIELVNSSSTRDVQNITLNDFDREGIQLVEEVEAQIIEVLNPLLTMIYPEIDNYPMDRDLIPDNLKELAPTVEGISDEVVARAYSDIVYSNISANNSNFSFIQIDPDSLSGLKEIAENRYELAFGSDYSYILVGGEFDSTNHMMVQFEYIDGNLEILNVFLR